MRHARSLSILSLVLASLAAIVPACDGDSTAGSAGSAGNNSGGSGASTSTAGSGGTSGGSGGTSAGGSGGTGASNGGNGPVVEVACQNQTYQCGNTLDDDGDGLIDAYDPDCLGPCDNTEDGYYGGIPGQPGPACVVDCYWDSNSGAGNDECYWSHQCDPNEIDDPGHPEPNDKCPYDTNVNISGTSSSCDELLQAQTDVCEKVCGPLTPNGCDCFGCCELPAGTGKFVWLGSEDEATGEGSCKQEFIDDPNKCEPCIPVPSCYNGCGKCEVCVGKPDVPPECNEGGAGGGGNGGGGNGGGGAGGSGDQQCEAGVQACGLPGQDPCPADYYCITGCCIFIEGPK
jgi:hypothetical protein